MLKQYRSLPKYLLRFTILKISRLHVRFHHILSSDGTPYVHTHPFNYISIILKGSYVEQLEVDGKIKEINHTRGSIIVRHHNQYHRIKSTPGAITLFITWKVKKKWDLKPHSEVEIPSEYTKPSDGIHQRLINNKLVWSKALNGVWYIGSEDKEKALLSEKYSIYQTYENKVY